MLCWTKLFKNSQINTKEDTGMNKFIFNTMKSPENTKWDHYTRKSTSQQQRLIHATWNVAASKNRNS